MKTVSEIRRELEALSGAERRAASETYREDPRKSVIQLLEKFRKEEERELKEQERLLKLRAFELDLAEGRLFCGIDEAGRGPLAGPVVAAAVIMPADKPLIPHINDSKQVPEGMREILYDRIRETAVSVGVGIVSHQVIDEINILQATYEAMRKAVAALRPEPEILINDAVTIPGLPMWQIPVIKGDAKCYSIAAASIIAKVTRDRMMREYDALYPEYGFAENKGYGSRNHIEAIREKGLCPIHRLSFTSGILAEKP